MHESHAVVGWLSSFRIYLIGIPPKECNSLRGRVFGILGLLLSSCQRVEAIEQGWLRRLCSFWPSAALQYWQAV